MGGIGTERREVEFEPVPDDPAEAPGPAEVPAGAPADDPAAEPVPA